MQYALLIYSDEADLPEKAPLELQDLIRKEFEAAHAAMQRAGIFRSSHRLWPSDSAKTQRVRDGRVLTTDGPFADTKECLAGLVIVECETEAEALEHAARIPLAKVGSVEVRPMRPCGE